MNYKSSFGYKSLCEREDSCIDGSKFEANANKYTCVWKKETEKSRYRLYEKITELATEINKGLSWSGIKIQTNTEYVLDERKEVLSRYAEVWNMNLNSFIYGKGHRKTI